MGDGVYFIVTWSIVIIDVTSICWSGLNVFCCQSSWFMTSMVVEFGSNWVANLAYFTTLGRSSMLLYVRGPTNSIDLSVLIQKSQGLYLCHVGSDIV